MQGCTDNLKSIDILSYYEYTSLFATCDDGRMYVWGDNRDGALGVGLDEAIVNKPTPIKMPDGVNKFSFVTRQIIDTYPPRLFTYAQGDNGKIYAWGSNRNGILGIGSDKDNSTTPQQVLLDGCTTSIFAVSLQDLYYTLSSYAKCDDGSMRAWGSNAGGKLGVGLPTETVNTPTRITRQLKNLKICAV